MFHSVEVSSSCIHFCSRDYGLALQEFWRHGAWDSISVHLTGFLPQCSMERAPWWDTEGLDEHIGLEWGGVFDKVCHPSLWHYSRKLKSYPPPLKNVNTANWPTTKTCWKPKQGSHKQGALRELHSIQRPLSILSVSCPLSLGVNVYDTSTCFIVRLSHVVTNCDGLSFHHQMHPLYNTDNGPHLRHSCFASFDMSIPGFLVHLN